MKSKLKMTLGLEMIVTLMMITIINGVGNSVYGQNDTLRLTLEDFVVVDVYNYNTAGDTLDLTANSDINSDFFIDFTTIQMTGVQYNGNQDSVRVIVKAFDIVKPDNYIKDSIDIVIVNPNGTYSTVEIRKVSYFDTEDIYTIEMTFRVYQVNESTTINIKADYLGLISDEETASIMTIEENPMLTVTSFNKEITIKSSDYQTVDVDIQIYNMNGNLVETLSNIELTYADTKVSMYDSTNGVYLILIKDNYINHIERHKVMIQ